MYGCYLNEDLSNGNLVVLATRSVFLHLDIVNDLKNQ